MDLCGAVNFAVVIFGQGPIVTLVVQLLKRVPLVANNPLATAAVLNALAVIATGIVWCGLDVSKLIMQLVAGFSTSVAAYEVGKKVFAPQSQPAERPDRE